MTQLSINLCGMLVEGKSVEELSKIGTGGSDGRPGGDRGRGGGGRGGRGGDRRPPRRRGD